MSSHNEDNQTFGSIESLMESIAATETQEVPVTLENEKTDQPVEEAVRLNQPEFVAEVPALQVSLPEGVEQEVDIPAEVVEVTDTPDEVPAPVFSTPSINATIAEDVEAAKKNDTHVELVNVVMSAMRSIAAEREAPSKQTENIKRVLSEAIIDPDNIQIDTSSSANPLLIHSQLSILEKVRPAPSFPVIALKSGYRADFGALNNNEKITVRNINGSILDQTTKLLRLVHSKVLNTSVGGLKFEDFLNITAEDDFDTLLYGIYYATFPTETEYSVTCPHCERENKVKLCPDHLIEVIDQERAGKYVNEVLNNYGRGREFLENSLVAKPNRIVLPESKIVVELITPTLRRMLDNLRLAETLKQYQGEIVTTTKYIGKMFIPNIEAMMHGNTSYFPMANTNEIVGIVNGLSGDDFQFLRKALSARYRQYRVEYRIPNFNCAHGNCSKEIANIDMDLTRMIFFAIGAESAA